MERRNHVEAGLFPNGLLDHLFFFLWVGSWRTSHLFLSCFSSSLVPSSNGLCVGGGRTDCEFLQNVREEDLDHGMSLDSSETVTIHLNNTCFTATLVVLCLLMVLTRSPPRPLDKALLQQSVCTFRSIFYTTVTS